MRTTAMVLAAATLTGAMVNSVSADLIQLTELHATAFQAEMSPGVTSISLPRFDDKNGTRELREVSLLVNAVMSAGVSVENDSLLAAPGLSLGMSGFMTVDFGPLSAVLGFEGTRLTEGIGPTDGIEGSGVDFWSFGLVETQTAASDTTRDLVAFMGGGTIDAEITASGGFSISGADTTTLTVSDFMTRGNVQVMYGYAQIPGPAGLAVLAAGGLIARRRRRLA